ncbi:MAG: PH domain-containing protein [Ruminococcus sp.]|nr:PH domain-containing protein [Ruminococcus sp.]
MKHKSSPIYIAVFLYRFAFLLLALPLQAVLFEGTAPQVAVYMYRLDIFILGFLCIWAAVCYGSIRYSTRINALVTQKGVLFTQKNQVFLSTFDTLRITANPVFRLFKVCKIQTTASRNIKALYLNRKSAETLINFFCTDATNKSKKLNSNLFSVLIFSAGFSGALTGLLSAIPLLRNIAGILGESNTQNILASADLWVYIGYTALPPFLRTLSTLFLWAWGIGTFAELNRYLGLTAYFQGDRVIARHGLFTKHLTVLRTGAVACVVLRQSILLYFLGLFTAEVYLPTGKRETKVPLLLASKKEKCKDLLHALGMQTCHRTLPYAKPPASTLWGYVWKPLLFLSFVSLLSIGVDILTPYRVEVHLMVFITLWGCVWFLFSAFAHKHSALFYDSSGLIIRTAQGLSFTTVHIPRNKVRAIRTTQNIFQRRKGVCNLYVYVRSARRQYFLIKHIDKSKTAQLTLG